MPYDDVLCCSVGMDGGRLRLVDNLTKMFPLALISTNNAPTQHAVFLSVSDPHTDLVASPLL